MKIVHGNKGKIHSLETRLKLSDIHKGKSLSLEHRTKISEANKLRKLSEETKNKIRISHLGKIGYKHKPETIERMRNKRKLQIFTKETRNKISISAKSRVAELNPNWKGGITPVGLRIRTCNKYIEWRQKVFLRDDFCCQKCGDATGGNLEAHHIKKFSVLIEEVKKNLPLMDIYSAALMYSPLWDIKNGETLCETCHKTIGGQ